jgi:outer membrane protein TolC
VFSKKKTFRRGVLKLATAAVWALLMGLVLMQGSRAEGQSQSSPYPAWGSQAGPQAPLKYSPVTAAVTVTSKDFEGSVPGGAATGEVLPLSLDDAIRRGLETNLGLRLNQQGQQVASGQRSRALQPLLPAATATGYTSIQQVNLAAIGFRASALSSIGRITGSDVMIPEIVKFQTTNGQANLSWTMLSLPNWERYQAAKLEETAAGDTAVDSRQTVVLNVGQAYLECLADAAQLDNAKSLLDLDKKLLDDAVAEHEAGVAANLDELRARVQYQTQQQAVIAADNALKKQEIALRRMIGLRTAQAIQLTDMVPYAELDAETLPAMRTKAYEARADYLGQQAQVAAAERQRSAAKWVRLPTLSFSGFYGVIGITQGPYRGDFFAGGTLAMPLFNEAKIRGDRDVAESQLQQQKSQLDDMKTHIDAELRTALLDVETGRTLVEVARSNLALSTKELEQANDRFAAGVDDNLGVVQAQSTLSAAQSQLVNSLYSYNVAKLQLARAMGTVDRQYGEYLRGK